jgi:succinate dehydrogenase hydrophobic anchor subunit
MEPLKFVTQMVASHISGIAHLPILVLLSFHSLIGMPSIVADRSAILVYAYLMLEASLLIKAAFRRSRIVNIDG